MQESKKEIFSRSLSYNAWKRLKRNKLAMLGLFIILAAVVVALLGPVIRPDKTQKANDQIIELPVKKPGFEVLLLKVRKNKEASLKEFYRYVFYGVESDYKSVPIYSCEFRGKDILVKKHNGGEDTARAQTAVFSLADVVYPIELGTEIKDDGKGLSFKPMGADQEIYLTYEDLQKKVKEEQLVIKKFYLGTDRFGRDLLSRLMAGTKISLSVGFISVFISLLLGVLLGALAGYFRSWVDNVIMLVINIVWSIPTLLLVIAISLVLGKGYWQVFVAVGLTMWVEVARIVRGQVLSIREKEYVEAGRALGYTNFRIIFKHVLPNAMGPVIVISASNFASAILIEAGLSFLGIGASPPQATWGRMINENKGYIITGDAYLALLPGLAIMLMVLAFMLVGKGLRDALDTRLTDDMGASV